MFPNSKFILMIRDGRSLIHSLISRNLTQDENIDFSSFENAIVSWNKMTKTMYEQCKNLSLERCLPVFYERLVLKPKSELKKVLKFLNIPWNDSILNQDKFVSELVVASKSEIAVSKTGSQFTKRLPR